MNTIGQTLVCVLTLSLGGVSSAEELALNPQEKEIIRAWIAAGAPAPPSQTCSSPAPSGSVAPEPTPTPLSLTTRLFGWIGKFHILNS